MKERETRVDGERPEQPEPNPDLSAVTAPEPGGAPPATPDARPEDEPAMEVTARAETETEAALESEAATTSEKGERFYVASQWQLMWWRFTKHKMAVVGSIVVILFYLVAAFAEFLAPYDPNNISAQHKLAPPQLVRFVDSEGRFSLRPFVYELQRERNPETMAWIYSNNTDVKHPVKFFVRGDPYEFWGLVDGDVHLFGIEGETGTIFLLGADELGRDVFSRIVSGTRISMSIGLLGVFISLILGLLLGGLSGYLGGWVDMVIQRVIELLQSVPKIPLYMALAAAMPLDWSSTRVYFMMVTILSVIGWSGMARVVRGRFLSLRQEDFVKAARLCGSGELRIIFRHMMPSFLSHIIASTTLAIPAMILSETSLSFLGVGMRPPTVSWGVLLQEAQNIRTVAYSPWLLTPGLAVIIIVMAFNFMGDGLRDAADPYGLT
jgi:peptide/nickel transport system permease protein